MGPDLFCIPLGTSLAALRQRFESTGVGIVAYMDSIKVPMLCITKEVTVAVPLLHAKFTDMGVTATVGKTVILSPPGHVPKA